LYWRQGSRSFIFLRTKNEFFSLKTPLVLLGFYVSSELRVEYLSWSPQVIVFDNFLSPSECDLIIQATMNTSKYQAESAAPSISVYFPDYPRLRKEFQDIGK
jgi:hypothetical protein